MDKPEEVLITEIEGQQTIVIELKVAREDIGKIIGKRGRMVQAMRTILSAASTKKSGPLWKLLNNMMRIPSVGHCHRARGFFHLLCNPI